MIPAVYPIVGLSVALAALAAILFAPCLKAFRRIWFLAAAVAAILYAGTKPTDWTFEFNLGLHDAGSTVDRAEGVVVARWTWDAPVAGHVFRWSYSVNGGDYIRLPDASVTDGTATAVIRADPADAVRIQCYPLYVPPVHVVTNGVYHMDGVMRSMDSTNSPAPKFVTPSISIFAEPEAGERRLLAPITNAPPVPVSSNSATPENQGE